MINGYLKPDSGKIFFGGQDITGQSPCNVTRKGIARTFQLVRTFNNMTAIENVMVGCLLHEGSVNRVRKTAENALELVGLLDKKDVQAENLTLMDRKKVELARALSTRPKLLLLDEFLTGLNPNETNIALQLVNNLRDEGLTICLIDHLMKAVMSVSDSIVVLNFGEKISEGVPKKVANDPKVIEAYLGEAFQIA
jgi:branched-chain amino acid transport system ATP-binding protein